MAEGARRLLLPAAVEVERPRAAQQRVVVAEVERPLVVEVVRPLVVEAEGEVVVLRQVPRPALTRTS